MKNKIFTKIIKKEKLQNENLRYPNEVNSLHNVWTVKLYSRNDRVRENQQNCRINKWDRYLWNIETDYRLNKYKYWLTFMVGLRVVFFAQTKCKEPTCSTDYKIYKWLQPCALRCWFFYKFLVSGDLVQCWCWYFAGCFNYDPGIWLLLRLWGGP